MEHCRYHALTVHATDTSIANPTMMGEWRFEGLTLTTHGQSFRLALFFGRYRRGWYTSRIGQGGFDVTGQGQTTYTRIDPTPIPLDAPHFGNKGNGKHGISQQDPYHQGHDRPRMISLIEPYAMFIGGPQTTIP